MASLPTIPARFSIDELLAKNRSVLSNSSTELDTTKDILTLYASSKEYAISKHKALPPLRQMLGNDAKKGGPHVVVVSCLDSRANPYEVLNFKPYEIISIRNVSGRITPTLIDIATLDAFFQVNQVIILHHSNCGVTHISKEHALNDLQQKCSGLSAGEIEYAQKHAPVRVDDEEGLKGDVETLRASRFLRKDIRDNVLGLWLDVETGVVREVKI